MHEKLLTMKTEISWKQRLCRKKLTYMLLSVFIMGFFFVAHQLLYLKELNRITVGKLITGPVNILQMSKTKVKTKWNNPQHSKLIRDRNGHTVSLRGTLDHDISKYLPNNDGKFTCFKSEEEINFFKINDDYCDCPEDGSDEPGTNACNNGFFFCEKSFSGKPEKIASFKVNDGFCDCCDGSDEWIVTTDLIENNSNMCDSCH